MTDRLPQNLRMLALIDHMDRDVVLLCDDKSVVIYGSIYVCITQEALQKTAESLMIKYNRKHGAQQVQLGYAIDDLFFFDDAKKIVISGLMPGDIELTRDDLEPLRLVSECFVYMHQSSINKMNVSDVYSKMKDISVFIQGKLPSAESNVFRFSYLNRKNEEGKEYKAVIAYLTYEHAEKYNNLGYPITPCKLSFLRDFFGAVIVEPNEHYWIEFIRKDGTHISNT